MLQGQQEGQKVLMEEGDLDHTQGSQHPLLYMRVQYDWIPVNLGGPRKLMLSKAGLRMA